MKSFLKITFPVFLHRKSMTNGIYCAVLIVLAAMAISGCKKDNGGTTNDFPVNKTFASELIGKGIPADIAQFFAAARMETKSPNDTTCIYLQTFPNGATREMTLRVSPKRQYTPTPDEIANTSSGSIPIYGFKYASSVQADNTTQIDMNYYVAKSGLPKGDELLKIAAGTVATDGAGISWEEIGKKGADVGIGSVIDYYKDKGVNVGNLGSAYALASALSDVTGALDLSKQTNAWMTELDALEKCAANPTNQVARSDPNYSAAAVAKIQAARSELKQVSAVRFLNNMTETGTGITPVTAVLSVGLRQGFLWSEQTLNNYSENTIMRESRLTVVPCNDSGVLDGNIDVLWECLDQAGSQSTTVHEVVHTVTKVKWVFDPASRQYVSQGSYTFEDILTFSLGGDTCTTKRTSTGDIGTTGRLLIITEPALQNLLGFSYSAQGEIATQVATSHSCSGIPHMEPYTIIWLPPISGFPGTGGSYEGEMTKPSCIGITSTGTVKVKWAFSVPPAN
jgi:hypothetical protein